VRKSVQALAAAVLFLLLPGCSSEMAKRTAYESLQIKAQADCQQHPGSACPEKRSYDDYQSGLNPATCNPPGSCRRGLH
jgi:hypothetical protein